MIPTPPTADPLPALPESTRGRATWAFTAAGLVAVVALGAGALAITGTDPTDLVPDTCPEPIIFNGRPGDPGIEGVGNWWIARHAIPNGTTWTEAGEERLVKFTEVSHLDPADAWAPEGSLNVEGIALNAVASCDIPKDAILVQSQWQDRHPTTTIDPTAIATWGTDYCEATTDYLTDLEALHRAAVDGADIRDTYNQVVIMSEDLLERVSAFETPPDPELDDAFAKALREVESLAAIARDPHTGRGTTWADEDQLQSTLHSRIRWIARRSLPLARSSEQAACQQLAAVAGELAA